MKFIVFTPGPIFTLHANNFNAAKKEVESYPELKRGWSLQWDRLRPGVHVCTVRDSNGKKKWSYNLYTEHAFNLSFTSRAGRSKPAVSV